MSLKDIEAGKKWIKSQFHKVAKELGVTIDRLEWREDLNHDQDLLIYEISGTRHIGKFSRSETEDSAAPTVQVELKKRIRELLEPFASTENNRLLNSRERLTR